VRRQRRRLIIITGFIRLTAIVGLCVGLLAYAKQSVLPSDVAAATDNTNSWWQPVASQKYRWYWQLQDDIVVSHDVAVYDIDIDTPQSVIDALKGRGVRLICYFSVGTVEQWRSDARRFPKQSLGKTYAGYPDERWLDIANYQVFADLMIERLDRCAKKGFDGVEGDNIDAFLSTVDSGFHNTRVQSVDYIHWLAKQSHQRGLAYGLKNATSIASEVIDSVDWIVTESCFAQGWCHDATIFSNNNKPVFMTEYVEYLDDFTDACQFAREYGFNAIYRDTGLTASGKFEECI